MEVFFWVFFGELVIPQTSGGISEGIYEWTPDGIFKWTRGGISAKNSKEILGGNSKRIPGKSPEDTHGGIMRASCEIYTGIIKKNIGGFI